MNIAARKLLLVSILSAPWISPVHVQAGETGSSLQPLSWEWNARLRHETVDDDAFARDANATTLRVRLAARFRLADDWSALVEGEGIAAADDRYNSGANGSTAYPVVADPTGVELNQAWLGWQGERAAGTLGRQRILVDNQRWIGNVGWRQNEQTFDALALEWKPSAQWTARYLWLDRVHRINGDDARNPLARERELDSHAFDLAWSGASQQWGGYVLAHEDRDVALASTITTGVRWTGKHLRGGNGWGWRAEFAQQREHANNPSRFSHDYWRIEPSLTRHGVTWRAGWEHLGGDGNTALQTPLATLHAFNGAADKFLVTPPGGLEDRYVGAGGALGSGALAKLKWTIAWHDFRADSGGDYGSELDASLAFPVRGKLTGLVKMADYRSDGFARDTTKAWLQLEWVR